MRAAIALACSSLFATPAAVAEPTAINAVVGDASWIDSYGRPPNAFDDDQARIVTHLQYVLKRLRDADVGSLPTTTRARRADALESLQTYIVASQFPRRTNDAYRGRRPRFIDDRGTLCAVGHLIVASGHEALARAINAQFEYAYVPQIDSEALLDWATTHGFTARELAMIQPSYQGAPRPESTRRAIEESTDSITIACAQKHPPTDEVRLDVRGLDSGAASVSTTDKHPFAVCFAKHASKLERGGGAYDGPTIGYRFNQTVRITPPQQIFAARLQRAEVRGSLSSCSPRPGPIPKSVTLEAYTDLTGLEVKATTSPANAEVADCLERRLKMGMRDFGAGVWSLRASVTKPMPPVITTEILEQHARSYVRQVAAQCRPTEGPAVSGQVEVTARRDAKQFEIDVGVKNHAVAECMRAKLQERLTSNYSVQRRIADDHYERYFRIDGDAHVKLPFAVDPAAKAGAKPRVREPDVPDM